MITNGSTIGKTVEGGRPLDIIRLGHPHAPYRILLRGRAHAFEGGKLVAAGIVKDYGLDGFYDKLAPRPMIPVRN